MYNYIGDEKMNPRVKIGQKCRIEFSNRLDFV